MYDVSKNFNMDITFDELIKYNDTCKIDMDSTHHFETYEGIIIYVSHPKSKEKFTIQLGVCEDGMMYEGDYGCKEKFKEIPIDVGIDILIAYKELIKKRDTLESLLVRNRLDKDMVKIKLI